MGMNLNDLIETKYIKQEDVDGEVLVTIRSVKKENVAKEDDEPKYKGVIKFDEFKKPMVANPTNLKRIAKAFGNDTEGWIEKQVILYVDPDVEFGGKIVGGLRLRVPSRIAKGAAPKRSLDDVNAELGGVDPQDPPF